VLAAIAYLWHEPPTKPYGGSVLGYALGTAGALLILWLLGYGIRKRRYSSTSGTVQGWLSAHVYLGTALVVIVTLHTGFELGWNVHSLAYVLMVLVVASGFYGVFVYLRVPGAITGNLGDETLQLCRSEPGAIGVDGIAISSEADMFDDVEAGQARQRSKVRTSLCRAQVLLIQCR